MPSACLLLGSNLGDREALLARAQRLVRRACGHIVKVSKIYETEPWGFEADTAFLNQALLINTPLTPQILMARCLEVESLLGRVRGEGARGYASRYMDIDILFYEELIYRTPALTLPHPRLHLRRFALEPLAEVAPEWKHPKLGLRATDLLYSLINTGGAK
ncbi:MAG: 2-amino-4-hydroxy-6-hydroxymethyldihydropteridine diphosphokinase [Bacteroidetes bacterium]|nr:2-amino-4-hydroxy-6-hydroxymethyldihydropteridine diphosphokinase [Bacteroidota bacterium]